MKHMKVVLAVMLLLTAATAFPKKSKEAKTVYAFGFSGSFIDTVVYYTPIHIIDSVALEENGFLPTRELYSYQLKEFLEKEYQQQNGTCMIYFSDKKNKLEKEYSKLLGKYKKSNKLIEVPTDKFKFTKPDLGEE